MSDYEPADSPERAARPAELRPAEFRPLAGRTGYALMVEWSDPPMPALVGPFASREAADAWAGLGVRDGEWEVVPIAEPTSVKI